MEEISRRKSSPTKYSKSDLNGEVNEGGDVKYSKVGTTINLNDPEYAIN